ncbi:MAG: transposase [Calditrichia bacterium]
MSNDREENPTEIHQRIQRRSRFANSCKGRSQAEVSREIGVDANTISNGIRLYDTNRSEVFPDNGNRLSVEEENRRLKKELASVKEDREILKKALAFFSKNSK